MQTIAYNAALPPPSTSLEHMHWSIVQGHIDTAVSLASSGCHPIWQDWLDGIRETTRTFTRIGGVETRALAPELDSLERVTRRHCSESLRENVLNLVCSIREGLTLIEKERARQ